MKLYFEQLHFSWEDMYIIYDETDQRAYQVKAEPDKKCNWIILENRNGMEIGRVKCWKNLFGTWKFQILQDETPIGTVEKIRAHGITRYILNCNRWRVYGNILGFEYDVFDGKYLVMHAGNEDNAYPGKYVIDTSYSNNEQAALLVALAMEAANSTLPSRKK